MPQVLCISSIITVCCCFLTVLMQTTSIYTKTWRKKSAKFMWKIRKLTTTALFNFPTCQVIMHVCIANKLLLYNIYVLIYLFSPSHNFCVHFSVIMNIFAAFFFADKHLKTWQRQNTTIIITVTVFVEHVKTRVCLNFVGRRVVCMVLIIFLL